MTIATRWAVTAVDELTIDYATQTTHPAREMKRNYGTARCRGTVTGIDWMDHEW
jgi:hypothetical protein